MPGAATEEPMETKNRNSLFWLAITHLDDIVGCLGLTVTLVVVSANVFLRYFLSSALPWVEEIATMGFAYAIFIGAAAVYKRHMHIGIDLIVNLLPKSGAKAVNFLVSAFIFVFSVFIVYLGWINAVEAWEKPTAYLKIPYFFINISIPVGFAYISAYSARDLIMLIQGKEREDGLTEGDTVRMDPEGTE